jgi:hypothetical protein
VDRTLKIALILTAVDKISSIVDKATSKAAKRIKKMNEFGNAAGLVGGAITGFLGETISAARENEIANKRLEQVFKSMGDVQGKAAKQAEDYAERMQMQIGVDDEVIKATQAKIATFKDVSSESARMAGIFDRTTQAAFDMAADGFGEADQNAVQLGKALQDPIKGLNALRRSGITFTDAERKKITTLVKTHKLLEAQKMVLNAIEHQVGGVATATADPLAKMKIAFADISKQLGTILLPYVQRFATWLTSFVPKISTWISKNQGLVKAIAIVGASLLVLGSILKFVGLIAATNPIVLIVIGIAAAAVAIIAYWTPIKDFFAKIWAAIASFFSAAWNIIKKIIMFSPLGIIIRLWKPIVNFFKAIFGLVWVVIKAAIAALIWVLKTFTPVGLIFKYWDKISAFFSNIWQQVKQTFIDVWNWVWGFGKKFYEAGKISSCQL